MGRHLGAGFQIDADERDGLDPFYRNISLPDLRSRRLIRAKPLRQFLHQPPPQIGGGAIAKRNQRHVLELQSANSAA